MVYTLIVIYKFIYGIHRLLFTTDSKTIFFYYLRTYPNVRTYEFVSENGVNASETNRFYFNSLHRVSFDRIQDLKEHVTEDSL